MVKVYKLAREFIPKLSSIFRFTMHSEDFTRLEDVLAFMKAYCDLMQIRYGDNIEFRFDILEKYNSYHVVPFSIQTLIENAVKHNVITNNQKLVVDIYTDADSTVTVSNMISPKIEQEAAAGIGLANLS